MNYWKLIYFRDFFFYFNIEKYCICTNYICSPIEIDFYTIFFASFQVRKKVNKSIGLTLNKWCVENTGKKLVQETNKLCDREKKLDRKKRCRINSRYTDVVVCVCAPIKILFSGLLRKRTLNRPDPLFFLTSMSSF